MRVKYPIRHWLGKYESWLIHLYGRKSMLFNDKYLERFFSHFPEASGCEQFGTPDVLAYKTWREAADPPISAFKIMQEVKCLDRFYRYLIEDCRLPLSNPATPFVKNVSLKHIVRRKKDSLRLEEYKRLLEVCVKFEPRLVTWMSRMIEGVRTGSPNLTSQMAGRLFKKVSIIAGMPFVTMRLIKRSLRHGLWREMIKDWTNVQLTNLGYKDGSDSLIYDPKLGGDPFAKVNVSTLHEWATVRDSCNHIVSIDGVPYQQHRPEPESP
jgi:hypothetical protein